ncbi:MAG: M55 family metallopeptidase [Candidatus Hodarchaeota archaeon]
MLQREVVHLLADIEGATGIWHRRQCHAGRPDWWQIGRPALTTDLNSVIDGARHGGASQIAVRDVHDRGFNLLVPDLRLGINYIGGVQFHPNAGNM